MKFQKAFVLLIVALLISVPVFAEKGPIVDKVYFDVRMQEDIGIQDTAQGKTDVFFYGLDGPQVLDLDQNTLDKLDIYCTPSGSWAISINPIPNKAPYTWEVEGKEYFNPLAIREVRFALNWLINRQYLVDEILAGAGGPMFSMATPGQPGTYKYNLVGSRLGMTPEGDEEKALADIETAMTKAANLPENKGRLKKGEKWWTFDGEPVTVKFLIRVDDPQGRMREGEYISQQIEKAKIKVERLLWDRSKALKTAYNSNPADYQWHLYTEGWDAGATRAFWEHIVCQMYAPWYGYMAGGANPDNWNYTNEKINELTKKAYTGNFLTEEEYWDTILEALELALYDANRIYVCYQNQYFVANKDSFNKRMTYGMGDGLNEWSLKTANTKDGILRATQFSARGGLFMSSWNPVGADGFSDSYMNNIAGVLYDPATFESPASAVNTPLRDVPLDVKTKIHRDKETREIIGDIKVAKDAVKYDPIANKFVEVGPDLTSMSKGEYKFRFSNFHHGIPMSLVDFIYANAFKEEWITEDYEGDPYFDAEYSSKLTPDQKIIVATKYDFDNERVTVYFDYNFPPSKERVASWCAPGISVSASGMAVGVSWEIDEALARLVVNGSESGKIYSFSATKEGALEVDVLRPTCVADIKAELLKMKEEKYVPESIKDFITADEALTRYDAAINFINKYGNAYISNGPFFIAKFDPDNNFIELNAFRDPSYPFESNYWPEHLKTSRLSIDRVGIPVMSKKGEDIMITTNISEVTYPEDLSKPAVKGETKIILITDTKEIEFSAKAVRPGIFTGKISGETTQKLEPGSYTIVIIASQEGAIPSTVSESIIIY